MFNAIFPQTVTHFRERIYRRYPAAPQQKLGRHNLFIFPSHAGFGFLVLIVVLWLIGTNYTNNLVLLLAFALTSLFVVCILHTFANLAGLEIQLLHTQPTFNNEDAEMRLMLKKTGKRARENIHLGWPDGNTAVIDLIDDSEKEITLFVPAKRRGWFNPGALLVETYFPLGLFRCWMRLSMDCKILVYPHPIDAGPFPIAATATEEGEQLLLSGAEEFSGYRSYQRGDSLRNVAWKQYSRGVGLYSKEFVSHADSRLWLRWDDLPGMDREARLSRLCFWVLQADKMKKEFGLTLPGCELKPGSGFNHKLEALKALALFEVK